ncbi:5-methyltetrahydropteroyltriglutamate--homocysteine S-methyltransferase [Pelistega ratti]|uniref:5-methyltetrahydropteroyltriglutamate-- homocysteine S-methyltransferase n=1 Tax=Pelistega ratti TaxID=2652177 RepID=UPI00135A0412|nr:5-methyltetrahydropteroyltriglutamate--homocysteine S-methyltransferase [Pelistega ratti]
MSQFHILGYPRIGAKRELKFAVEAYWKGQQDENHVQTVAATIREQNWQVQKQHQAAFISVSDFSFYDHVLDILVAVGGIPRRFGFNPQQLSLAQYFQLARGNAEQVAMEMTKWFDTNYHYIVPEWSVDTEFSLNADHLIQQIQQAKTLNHAIKPTLLGPISLLFLGKEKGSSFNRLDLLPKLLPVYKALLAQLKAEDIEWVQIDEPILTLDLSAEWLAAFLPTYKALHQEGLSILLATYFGDVSEHLALLQDLPIQGLHIDVVRAPQQLDTFVENWSKDKVLSLGIIDGRNVWRADLRKILDKLTTIKNQWNNNLWLAPSCSLLHSPQDLSIEEKLDTTIKSWLAFAQQKVEELSVLNKALNQGEEAVSNELFLSYAAAEDRRTNKRIHQDAVKARLSQLPKGADQRKSPFATRIAAQQAWLNLPLLPTTTIGSFPQTSEIRQARAAFKKGELSLEAYETAMKKEIAHVVQVQEELDIDVPVHGEAERNDMVEYFGEQLSGFVFTQFAWVQSYGSRCVKPPIIYGDVSRPTPMTVKWSSYAQSLTKRPMKGMLTGPVTILQWSFVRDDIPRSEVTKQIALALNDEVLDLEKAGIKVIQIDEPAIREGLPLKRKDWDTYLDWACEAFRLSSSGVEDSTQIHTHMCYSEFNDILPAIASMDADVITIETSRSDMELLTAFGDFKYPNDIGPGVYDIHSPRVPSAKEVTHLLRKALEVVDAKRLWVNPDCGLKTRAWPETIDALKVMVQVAKQLRKELS